MTIITSGNLYKAGAQLLINQHIKKETGNVAHVLFCEKSLKYLPYYHMRHSLVLKAETY